MEIKTIRTNQQTFINAEVNGANVNINYDFSETAPNQVNVYASYNGSGVSSTCNRSYNADGEYTPISENVVYPFNASFDAEMETLIEAIYIDPSNPIF